MIGLLLPKSTRAALRQSCAGALWLAFVIVGFAAIPVSSQAATTNFLVRGILKEINQKEQQLIIAHDAIPSFMEAMTMPFYVNDLAILTNVVVGDNITFQLHVTRSKSWIDHVKPISLSERVTSNFPALPKSNSPLETKTNSAATPHSENSLRYFKFTNELGQAVSLADFRGQAIALTFFFTRCPIPEFCPRLSRNFEEVQRKLSAMKNAPANWRLISVTFDPAHDTPDVLKAYGAAYQYDPEHWSFLTGPSDKIAEFARSCNVTFDRENGLFNHNFRTLIIDASNHLQMVFPTSGDLSESIVQELIKAAGATNRMMESATSLP
jgi:protein SCO1/2